MSLSPVYDNPASLALMPSLEGNRSELLDLAATLQMEAVALNHSLRPPVRDAIADLVRLMNCYYSNLIEGHDTRPVDIDRAMRDDYSADKDRRDLQHEARSHVLVQRKIDHGHYDHHPLKAMVQAVHRDFYLGMPEQFSWVANPDTGEEIAVQPGSFRTNDVQVGRHVAVAPAAVMSFMDHLENGYTLAEHGLRRIERHQYPCVETRSFTAGRKCLTAP